MRLVSLHLFADGLSPFLDLEHANRVEMVLWGCFLSASVLLIGFAVFQRKWRAMVILVSCGFFVACWIVATRVQLRAWGERARQEQQRFKEADEKQSQNSSTNGDGDASNHNDK
jgi:hypothetical protein